MVVLHVVAGSIALLAGFVALFARKGGPSHRRAGTAFAVAMLVMSASGAAMAAHSDKPGTAISVLAGVLAFQLVGTGWLAVRTPARGAGPLLAGLAAIGVANVAHAAWLAAVALAGDGRHDGTAPVGFLGFGAVAALATAFDLRVLLGARLDGRARQRRHLGRMGLAMGLATLSFFVGQADEFPAWLRHGAVMGGPPLLVAAIVLVHGARTLVRRRAPSPSGHPRFTGR